jgi:hypothetical protein
MSGDPYGAIGSKTWDQILRHDLWEYQPPLTVHMPIQPVHSADFVYVDCALNVSRRRVIPGLSVRDEEGYAAARRAECMFLEFAFDDPPFIPDLRLTRLSLLEGRYPIVRAEYFALGVLYRMEYHCSQVDGSAQSILWVKCTATNEGEAAVEAHVRAKVNFQPEEDVFDYHYVPFYWDATKWPECALVSLSEDMILRDGQVIGKIIPDGFSCEWEDGSRFPDSAYNTRFACGMPYHVQQQLRLNEIDNTLHFHTNLQPGEESSLSVALMVTYEEVSEEHAAWLRTADPSACRQTAIDHFKCQIPREPLAIHCPAGRFGEMLTAMEISTLQLLVRFPGKTDLMPAQGGSSERYFVWVWEAVFMIRPLLQLGHFECVREVLEFVFALQDAGYPPEGRLASLEGAIGTTGPRWLNSTGSALALAADYYIYSRDEEFLEHYLPKILRAADWIVREITATRRLNSDDSRPLWYGLMPYGCATDGDIGCNITFTDAYTFQGLEKVAALLEQLGHERAPDIRREANSYRTDIGIAVDGLAQENGNIIRMVPMGEEDEMVTLQFDNTVSAVHLANTGAVDVDSRVFRRFIDYFEKCKARDYFMGSMDREVAYMGVGEHAWHEVYLRRGEWKKAFAALRNNLKYGLTRDTLQVQERFSILNPAFTPWQPNGGGNGRIIEMMIRSIYYEHDDCAVLLGCIPFAWLEDNGVTELRNLRTPRGLVNLAATMTSPTQCTVELSGSGHGVLPRILRIPGHFGVESFTNCSSLDDATYALGDTDTCQARFVLKDAERGNAERES